jgi:hypothetical protein
MHRGRDIPDRVNENIFDRGNEIYARTWNGMYIKKLPDNKREKEIRLLIICR